MKENMAKDTAIILNHNDSIVSANDDDDSVKNTNGEILSDLLKSFTKDSRKSSLSDSGNDSHTDYNFLLDAMATCKLKDEEKKSAMLKNKLSNTKSEVKVSLPKLKETEPNKNNGDKNTIKSMKTLQVKIKVKKDKSHKSKSNNTNVEDITAKISSMNLTKNENQAKNELKQTDANVKEAKPKNRIKSDAININNEQKIKFVERGPICTSVNADKRLPPYNRSEIHRRSLSGGNVLMKPIMRDENVVPITVECINNNFDILNNLNQNVSIVNSNMTKVNLAEFDAILNQYKCGEIVCRETSDSCVDNINMLIQNQSPECTSVNNEESVFLECTQDDNYLSNTSNGVNIILNGYRSPTMDNLECAANLENENFYETQVIQNQEDEYLVFDTSPQVYSSPQFNFNQKPSEFIRQHFNSTSSGYGSPLQDINDYTDCIQKTTFTGQCDMSTGNTLNVPKIMFAPIAPIKGYICCGSYVKSAKQEMEEMFNNLDLKTQQNFLLRIHSEDNNKLMELLDSQLANWNKLDPEVPVIPQLELLYTTCERLLVNCDTMMKFLEVYSNNHTIIDRAVLTCSESPLVARYLAECMLHIWHNLLKDVPMQNDYIWNLGKSTVIHRAVRKGGQCAASLAGLLELNNLHNKYIFDVNRVDSEGYTPLHLACMNHLSSKCSCLLMVHVLLKHGKANPDIKDRLSGNTPLHVMVLDGSTCAPDLVTLLLKYNANPLIKNYSKYTPLDLARRAKNNSQHAKKIFEMLKSFK